MSTFSNNGTESVSPSLQLSSTGGSRYPNQFFDLSQQWMPPTVKELFRWCTFYYYNSPLIGSAITKISRYPITDLIFEDDRESVRELWATFFNTDLKMKDRLMEVNLDYHVYGNAFLSMHLPFTRFLTCSSCKFSAPISAWRWTFQSSSYEFQGTCKECSHTGNLKVKDVPYKDKKSLRLIRWSPENIHIKTNTYTGRTIYMYTVPYKLKTSIQRGDKDIIEDMPMIVIQALKNRRMIRFNNKNFLHLKRPTVAEQDMGWGKPVIIHVLKDMYYLYTLRRAQEAIAHEHIVPFDIIYPMPNAQQDPYIHTNLANWREQIEDIIRRHRRDPNFKGVIPVPVGFGRIGGDGKAMMLTPELNYLTQTIVGGMGMPQEFLFGGLNYTGSSISLRTLENDFIQNRSQLHDVVMWVKEKARLWLNYPDLKNIKFSDFRMADDVQRNQQLIGLNAQLKVSDQTMLTELGYDWEQEQKKMIEEAYFQNYLNDLRAKAGAKTQGEAGLIQFNYQQKIQELAQKAQADAARKAQQAMGGLMLPASGGGEQDMPPPQLPPGATAPQQPGMVETPQAMPPQAMPGGDGSVAPAQQMTEQAIAGGQQIMEGAMGQGQAAPMESPQEAAAATPTAGAVDMAIESRVKRWVSQIVTMPPHDAQATIMELKNKMPDLGAKIEQEYNNVLSQQTMGQVPGQMNKAPESPMAQGQV